MRHAYRVRQTWPAYQTLTALALLTWVTPSRELCVAQGASGSPLLIGARHWRRSRWNFVEGEEHEIVVWIRAIDELVISRTTLVGQRSLGALVNHCLVTVFRSDWIGQPGPIIRNSQKLNWSFCGEPWPFAICLGHLQNRHEH